MKQFHSRHNLAFKNHKFEIDTVCYFPIFARRLLGGFCHLGSLFLLFYSSLMEMICGETALVRSDPTPDPRIELRRGDATKHALNASSNREEALLHARET